MGDAVLIDLLGFTQACVLVVIFIVGGTLERDTLLRVITQLRTVDISGFHAAGALDALGLGLPWIEGEDTFTSAGG
ncbi:hypothetical protein D3C85_1530290 [compost metagenome]